MNNNRDYNIDDYYYNDEGMDNYYNNGNYDPNYNNYNNPNDYPTKPRKKGMGIATGLVIGLLSAASLAGIGVGIYFLVHSTTQSTNFGGGSSNNTNNGFNPYQGPSDEGKYILQRTLTLQFITENADEQNSCMVSCGTGWIINKDENDDCYYIATNLHVAALTTYPNHEIWSSEDKTVDNYGDMIQCLVGYTNDTDYENGVSNINMITVQKPDIVYTTAMDNNWSNLNYGTTTGEAYNGTQSYSLESDFAILKYDFGEDTLLNNSSITSSGIDPNTQTEFNSFESWLQTYNETPTQFLPNPIQDYASDNLEFAMGGYPSAESSTSGGANSGGSNGITPYQNYNYMDVVWSEFPNKKDNKETTLSGQSYDTELGRSSNVGNAYNVANNSTISNPASPIIYYDSSLNPESTNPWDGGYVNGAFGYLLSDSSQPGSSGSMLITQVNNQYYVVGIYWGSITFEQQTTPTFSPDVTVPDVSYGAADILNTNTNGGTYPGYNLFQLSYNYLINNVINNGASLYFNPITNQKN